MGSIGTVGWARGVGTGGGEEDDVGRYERWGRAAGGPRWGLGGARRLGLGGEGAGSSGGGAGGEWTPGGGR